MTIFECRPPWDRGLGSARTRQPIAQLRLDATDLRWTLYWADRNDRWHAYEMVKPTRRLETLLDEIDRDPSCIFWA